MFRALSGVNSPYRVLGWGKLGVQVLLYSSSLLLLAADNCLGGSDSDHRAQGAEVRN